jgi:hypothetical protein
MNEGVTESSKENKALYLWIFGFVFAVGFTILIWYLGPLLDRFAFLPDEGPEWYYWKLPVRDFTTMLIVWTFYLAHQFSIWGSIYWAQRNLKDFRTRPTRGLTKYNYAIIVFTVFFVVLHLIQTHIWFDGLAQDVPIWTSQGSVIIMLSLVLIIENPRRGLFMGRKLGKPLTAQVSGFFRRNHQYIIAWALVYTFWFHPMFYDPQLVSGFFYMFLLFTQVALAYTWIHLDKRWIVLLESYVGFHALIVAYFNTIQRGSSDVWPMFVSGFAFLFVFTYLYALDVRKEVRWLVTIVYIGFLVWLYLPAPIGLGRDIMRLFMLEMLWIPIALYGLAILFAGLVYVFNRQKPDKATH